MRSPDIPEEWLRRANERYSHEEISPRARPFRALLEYSKEFGLTIPFSSPVALRVFEWFKARAPAGAHAIGDLFTGTFFYDGCFWPVSISIGFGAFALNPFDALNTMPKQVKQELAAKPDETEKFTLYWADCLDYAYGLEDILALGQLRPLAIRLFENGDKELRGAIAQLEPVRPNPKAVISLALATEILMKAFLVEKQGLDEQGLKQFGHKVAEIAQLCFNISRRPEFQNAEKAAGLFPPMGDRYVGTEKTLTEVAEAVCISQMVAGAVAREFSDRDMRSQVLSGHP